MIIFTEKDGICQRLLRFVLTDLMLQSKSSRRELSKRTISPFSKESPTCPETKAKQSRVNMNSKAVNVTYCLIRTTEELVINQ